MEIATSLPQWWLQCKQARSRSKSQLFVSRVLQVACCDISLTALNLHRRCCVCERDCIHALKLRDDMTSVYDKEALWLQCAYEVTTTYKWQICWLWSMIYHYCKITVPQPATGILIQSIVILSFPACSSIMSFSVEPLSLLTHYLIYDMPTFLIMHFNCINVSIL